METDFRFTECEAYYKGKPLPFGKPIAEWEKLFGKPTRKFYESTFIWDNLGIVLDNDHVTEDLKYDSNFETRKYDKLFIFYSNLETPAGQKGKLKFAEGRRSAESLIEGYKKGNPEALTKDLEKWFIDNTKVGGKEGFDKYIYPYTTYKKSVTIDDSFIKPGMSLKELNKNRKALDLQIFTFRDDNMNLVNESGGTKGDYGQYWDDYRKLNCPKQDYYFFNSVQYSDSELEFIQVGYRTKDEESPYF